MSNFITVVSGLPRSGTSMMMKMLEAGGLEIWTDNIREADEDNPKGYYELERVKQLDKSSDKSWLKDSEGKVVKVISQLLAELPADMQYRIVFLRRKMPEVLASQKKMLERRGEPTDRISDVEMANLFAKHLLQVDSWLKKQPNMAVHYVWYHEVVAAPGKHANQINEFLGGHLDVEKMTSAVDSSLHRNKA